jgi:16S rRNA processing protein RimM
VVDVDTDRPQHRFQVGAQLLLGDRSVLTVARYEATDRSPLVRFAEIGDRTTAESYRGRPLYIESSERRDLEPDEFWPDELVGFEVLTREGSSIGLVAELEFGGAQDRLVIDAGGTPVTVPFVTALVPEVDVKNRRVIVDLPPGFMD